MNFIIDYDIALLRWVQANRLEYLDNFLYWVSFSTTFVSIGILFMLLYQAYLRNHWTVESFFVKLLSMFLASALVSTLLKNSFERVRPFVTYTDIAKLSEAGSYSFPSGHTAEAFTIAIGTLLIFRNKLYALPIFLWALLVAYSRMSLGVHYPTDVFVAIILAIVICFSINNIYKKWIIQIE